jgi:hypothetical protein
VTSRSAASSSGGGGSGSNILSFRQPLLSHRGRIDIVCATLDDARIEVTYSQGFELRLACPSRLKALMTRCVPLVQPSHSLVMHQRERWDTACPPGPQAVTAASCSRRSIPLSSIGHHHCTVHTAWNPVASA